MEDLVNRTVAKDPQLKTQHQMALSWQSRTGGVSDKTVVCGTVQEAIERVEREGLKEVLVTGSLHLIGSTMTCLDMPVA